MKRLIAAGIIFVLIVITGWLGVWTIRSTTDEVEGRIEQIQNTAFEDTDGKAEEFYYFWQSRREILAVFVNHSQVDEIGRLAADMVSAERSGDGKSLFESANEILYIVRGIAEDESFSMFTLL